MVGPTRWWSGPGPEQCLSLGRAAGPGQVKTVGLPAAGVRLRRSGARAPAWMVDSEAAAARWPPCDAMTAPAIRVHRPPPGQQSWVPRGQLAVIRREDGSGDHGALAPRPVGSRGNRAARWPSYGGKSAPAIRVHLPPARIAVLGTARPAWPSYGEETSSGQGASCPARTIVADAARPAGRRTAG
jgi:hypothetical protein